MKTYKILLQPLSSAITPFLADTIFGSFCWALRYLNGEKELEDFLNNYSQSPPLLVSDGFPEKFFPKPILKPVSHQQSRKVAKKYSGGEKKDLIKGLTKLKHLKKRRYIPIEVFDQLRNSLSEKNLLEKLLQLPKEKQPDSKTTLVFRNTINRFTNTVLSEGGLHPDEETFYSGDISIFVKTAQFLPQQLEEIFNFIAQSGFGKSASAGKGALLLKSKCEEFSLPEAENPNAFLSLSSFVPNRDDPTRGYYEMIVKYGKLGGDYAKSSIPGVGMNPFKKPLIMFKAGSIFFDEPIKDYYGRLIGQIHHDERIKHYGYAFPVRVRVDEAL